MRVPIVAIIRSGGRTQRPGDLGSHVAKDILGERDKIRAVGGIGMAKVQRAMGSVLARDVTTAHSGGASFDHSGGTRFGTLLKRRAFPLDHRASAGPETVWLPGLVHVVFEDHSGEVAVGVSIPTVVASKVGEVLHVDLDGGCADVIAVTLVEPGAGGFVAVVTDDDIRICPGCSTACLARVIQTAALGAVGPFLRDVCDAEAVIAGVNLDIGWLLAWKSRLIDGHVLISSGGDISAAFSTADERLVLIVDVNFLDSPVSSGRTVAV